MKHPSEPTSDHSNRLWYIRLFEGPILETSSGEETRRFRSQKVGALLAYLALRLGRRCSREELAVAIWSEEDDPQIVANRLRVALASLRRQLEPAGVPFGTVLDVSQTGLVSLRAETVGCDVIAFERAFKAGRKAEAKSLATGTLLPGYYEDWVILERERLESLADQLDEVTDTGVSLEVNPALSLRREAGVAPGVSPLPLYLTRYFGRENEKLRLLELLAENRLVTLTGAGGMGKTRLSVETAKLAPLSPVFVSLAEVTDGEKVPGAILSALGVFPSVEADLTEQIIAIFRRRAATLLILDNAEHLLEAVAELTLKLLQATSWSVLLVTSRQPLDIAGEVVFALSPLEIPPADNASHEPKSSPIQSLEDLIRLPAVALFLDRARRARPDFVLTPRYLDAMTQLCRSLEGVPLALELAAARIVIQTPAQIAEALAEGLLSLKSQQHGFSVRHRSLRASIQGSYDLLPPDLQIFFARLSVFQGGWTVEAARFVTDCPETAEFLEELVRRSLLVTADNEKSGVMRCKFLEVIRQFAAELLTEAERTRLMLRHADYFAMMAAAVSEDDVRSLIPLDSEQENLLLALETGVQSQSALFCQGVIGSLYYAYIRGHNRLFLHWAERSLELRNKLPTLEDRVRLSVVQYLILGYVGSYDLVRKVGETLQNESQEQNHLAGSVLAKLILSYVAIQPEDFDTVMRLTREALTEARTVEDTTLHYRALRLVAWFWLEYATTKPGLEPETSRSLLIESKALAEECLSLLPPHSSQITFTLTILAKADFELGNEAAGYVRLKSAQQTAITHGMEVMLIFCYDKECEIAIAHSLLDYAALLYGAFRALRERTGYISSDASQKRNELETILRERLGDEHFETLARRGEQTPVEEMATFSLDNPYLS